MTQSKGFIWKNNLFISTILPNIADYFAISKRYLFFINKYSKTKFSR